MLSLLAPLLVFGLVVFVHELGHFLAAKATGVYAPRFSIGFGPALFRKRWGETEYVIAALPLGGYVRMASREDETMQLIEGGGERPPVAPHEGQHPGMLAEVAGEAAGEAKPRGWDPEAMYPFGPKPVPSHRWFESKSLAARLVIMLAGVTMNVVLAVIVTTFMVAHYGRSTIGTRVVGGVTPEASAALGGRIAAGDTVLRVGDKAVKTWDDVMDGLSSGERSVSVVTHRDSFTVNLGEQGSDARKAIVAGLDFYMPPIVDSVIADMPAGRAGLQAGDSIVSIDGEPVDGFTTLSRRVAASAGKSVRLDLVRGGVPTAVSVVPQPTPVTDGTTGESKEEGKIGIVPRRDIVHEDVPLASAVPIALRITGRMTGEVFTTLKRLANKSASVKELGGPIAIARTSVQAARQGAETLLYLIALLSVNVAVLNLLPIPILDGGQVLLNVAEAVKGSAFSARTREYILRAGLLAIGLLFVTVMWNDITRLITDVAR